VHPQKPDCTILLPTTTIPPQKKNRSTHATKAWQRVRHHPLLSWTSLALSGQGEEDGPNSLPLLWLLINMYIFDMCMYICRAFEMGIRKGWQCSDLHLTLQCMWKGDLLSTVKLQCVCVHPVCLLKESTGAALYKHSNVWSAVGVQRVHSSPMTYSACADSLTSRKRDPLQPLIKKPYPPSKKKGDEWGKNNTLMFFFLSFPNALTFSSHFFPRHKFEPQLFSLWLQVTQNTEVILKEYEFTKNAEVRSHARIIKHPEMRTSAIKWTPFYTPSNVFIKVHQHCLLCHPCAGDRSK